jgi:Uma2 family endonuclease
MAIVPVRPTTGFERRRWTRPEYYRMLDAGILTEDDPVELIDGEVVLKVTQNHPQATATTLAARALDRAFGTGHHVRVQMPMTIGNSEPEPDVAVLPGEPDDYADHPSTALLVLEVADSSLAAERLDKASLYAAASIQDYWITNLVARQIEVLRDPIPMTDTPFGFGYRSRVVARSGEVVRPLARTGAEIPVDALLPRRAVRSSTG